MLPFGINNIYIDNRSLAHLMMDWVLSTCQAITAFVFKRWIPIQKKDYEIPVFQISLGNPLRMQV